MTVSLIFLFPTYGCFRRNYGIFLFHIISHSVSLFCSLILLILSLTLLLSNSPSLYLSLLCLPHVIFKTISFITTTYKDMTVSEPKMTIFKPLFPTTSQMPPSVIQNTNDFKRTVYCLCIKS